MKLQISDTLSLPLEFVTQTQAILAKKRAGKSYTASVQAEELLKARQQIIVIDVTGAWWGLRSSADGRGAGHSILVAGGDHGDIPLEESAGEVMASAIVGDRFSAILDLSAFRKGAALRFLANFLETIYRLNRHPVHLFADEADFYCPQKPYGVEDARTIGALDDIVRRGGIRGIGCSLITQRPAVLNANVRTQCGILTTLRLSHPLDIKAIMEWVNVHADPGDAAEMMKSLPDLPTGTAWVWAPGWPAGRGIFQRVEIRERETFDSGATPKAGQVAKRPKVLAAVDVEKLGASIKATVEKAKENDPAALKKQVADLKRQLAARPAEARKVEVEKVVKVEVPVLKNGQLNRTEKLIARLEAIGQKTLAETAELRRLIAPATAPQPKPPASPVSPPRQLAKVSGAVKPAGKPRPAPHGDPPSKLNGTQQRILDALAWYERLGNAKPSLTQIGAVALIDSTGGHFSNIVGPLSSGGLVVREPGFLALTDAGRLLARAPEVVGTLNDYHEVLRSRVRKMKSASGKTIEILNVIIEASGRNLTTDEIGQAIAVDHTGGHFSNCIGPLGTAGLITRRGGIVTPTEILFPTGLS